MGTNFKAKILIIDDEKNLRTSLRRLMEGEGFAVEEAEDGKTALEMLFSQKERPLRPHLIFLDVRLPDADGMNILDRCKNVIPEVPVIVITGYGNVQQSVEAMRRGAADYVLKPFHADEIVLRAKRVMDTSALKEHVGYLNEQLLGDWDEKYVIGPNSKMQKIYKNIESLSKSANTTVLICGQTGVGKELIARRIHQLTCTKERPFIAINATALSAELLESELFGHEAGAFTGAVKAKKGLFEVAHGGTLFLDEIGDMPISMQAKLLRALQEKTIRRVGGIEEINIDIRLVTATNKDLAELVKQNRFREDLYYRLSVVVLEVPPLCERKDDIEILIKHFIREFNHECKRSVKTVTNDALQALVHYSWPGNIRELRNVIERAILLECNGETLALEHLKFDYALNEDNNISQDKHTLGENIPLEFIERQHIEAVLQANNGNKNLAAQILGIDRTTLYNKLKKYHGVK